MMSSVVGIDLGTTNSVVASLDDRGEVIVVPNAVGERTTPSVVYFDREGGAVVGSEALQEVASDPDNGVRLIKRQMGTDFPLRVGNQEHTPESISALILRHLVSTVRHAPGERVRAVITVPAYFGLSEREATYQAGVIAGIEVLELLDEPVAAAAHYGLLAQGDRTVLVYDLGGGTFDTTVLRISSGAVAVVATDGHHSLGGADFDQRLFELVLARLEDEVPRAELEVFLEDVASLGGLLLDVETVKRELSSRLECSLVVRLGARRVTVGLTRADFEAACTDLFETTEESLDRVLAAAHHGGAGRVDDVIMVGGSSRIPVLAARLGAKLGCTPRLLDPDLAVAKGAALRAHQRVGTEQMRSLTGAAGRSEVQRAGHVTTVSPRSVGILVEDSFDPSGERRFIDHVVQANTPLPVTIAAGRFGTIVNQQPSVRVQVFEQAGAVVSQDVAHNRRVLDGELTDIGALPAGSVIKIIVAIAVDGRLTVTAQEPISGRTLTLEACIEGVIDAGETERLTQLVGRTEMRG